MWPRRGRESVPDPSRLASFHPGLNRIVRDESQLIMNPPDEAAIARLNASSEPNCAYVIPETDES